VRVWVSLATGAREVVLLGPWLCRDARAVGSVGVVADVAQV